MVADRANFVLLHGTGFGAWIWDELRTHLDGPSLAPDLPALRGAKDAALRRLSLDDAARSVTEEITSWGRDRVVLVCHSLGGAVGLAAAARIPDRVSRLVFVSAAIPPDGGSCMPLLPPGQRAFLSAALRWAPGMSSPGGGRGPWAAAQRAGIRSALCGGLDDRTADRVARGFTPAAPRLYRDRVRWSGVPAGTPRHYVKLLADRSGMSPARQDRMVANLGDCRVHALDTGHLPMLGRPSEFAAILHAVRDHPAETA